MENSSSSSLSPIKSSAPLQSLSVSTMDPITSAASVIAGFTPASSSSSAIGTLNKTVSPPSSSAPLASLTATAPVQPSGGRGGLSRPTGGGSSLNKSAPLPDRAAVESAADITNAPMKPTTPSRERTASKLSSATPAVVSVAGTSGNASSSAASPTRERAASKPSSPTKARTPSRASVRSATQPRELDVVRDSNEPQLNSQLTRSSAEALSLQRRSAAARASMSINLQVPDLQSSPLLHYAAVGDVSSMLSAARSYAAGFSSNLSADSDGGIAALRSDSQSVTALHYAAYFGRQSCVVALLDLACSAIRSSSTSELSSLFSKRQRFLDVCRYAYRQHDDAPSRSATAGGAQQQALTDAHAFASWIRGELLRVLRARELRCEERWKQCLRARDAQGRTPLMYAAAGKGDVDTMTALLTNGRANLGAVVNDKFDVEKYVTSTHGDLLLQSSSGKKAQDSSSRGGSSRARDVKKGADYHHVQHPHCFIPPPCNSTKSDALTLLLAGDDDAVHSDASPLFPRDEMFHIKTGHLKASQNSSDMQPAYHNHTSSSSFSSAFDPSSGADPVSWVCGRLLAVAEEQRGKRSVSSLLSSLFEEFDNLGVGSIEVKNVEKVLAKNGIDVTEGIAADVATRFKDQRNRNLTCKYAMLVEWAIENCHPIYKAGVKVPSPRKINPRSPRDRGESKNEESKDDDAGESKKDDDDDEDHESNRRRNRKSNRRDNSEEKKSETIENQVHNTLMGDSSIEPTSFTDVGALRESRCKLIDTVDDAGRTALHVASAAGEVAIVKVLVKFGASREVRAHDGESALSYAGTKVVRSTLLNGLLSELEGAGGDLSESQKAKLGNWIMMLGEGGLNVNDPLGGLSLHTPLHIAAIAALPTVTDVLLARRASPTETDENGWTALHHCAARGGSDRREVATKLISAGADVNARSSYFRTPLHLAAIGASACTDFEPPSRAKGKSPSAKTADPEDTRMIEILVTNGADLDAVDEGGCTPLHRAAEQGRVHSVHALVSAGCSLYAVTPKGWNVLHYAAFNGHVETCLMLAQLDAERGRLVGQRDCQRCTPREVAKDDRTRLNLKTIFTAARDADVDSLVKCISLSDPSGMAGRKPWLRMNLEDQTRPSGLRVLHCAVLGHAKFGTKAHLDSSRSSSVSSSPRSPSASSRPSFSSSTSMQVVRLLLDAHAFVSSVDFSLRTPLHLASALGDVPVVELLLSRDADVNATDAWGTGALGYAYAFGKLEVADILIRNGADEGARNYATTRRRKDEGGSESDEEEDDSDDDRRGKRGTKNKSSKRDKESSGTTTRKKGRLPRECAGMREKIFPAMRNGGGAHE